MLKVEATRLPLQSSCQATPDNDVITDADPQYDTNAYFQFSSPGQVQTRLNPIVSAT